MAMRGIKIGHRFMKINGPSRVWEVIDFKPGPGGIIHCIMRDMLDPTRAILVSERALRNNRFFKLIEAET